jgi:hypothetical protein
MPPEHKAARSNRAGRASIAASFTQLAAIFLRSSAFTRPAAASRRSGKYAPSQ